MIERMIWILFPIFWGKVLADPRNCNQISRSDISYKYPYQQTKTILFQVPYQNVASASSKHPQIAIQDSNNYRVVQQALPSNIYPEQFHHVPILNNINQQYLSTQETETKPRISPLAVHPNFYLPSATTPHHIYIPNQHTFNQLPIKTETIHRPIVQPYHMVPVVPLQSLHAKIVTQPTQPVPANFQIYSPQVKATPIVYNQVYHPVFPTSQNIIKMPQVRIPQPHIPQPHIPQPHIPQAHIPRYYAGFHPIPPPIPIKANIPVKENQENKREEEEEEDKEELNENQDEEEQDHENIENDEREPETDVPGYKQDYDFNDNFFKNSKYSFPRFDEGQDKESNSYKVRDSEEQEDESEDEESIRSFVFAQPYIKSPHYSKPVAEKLTQFKPTKKPKTQVKMIRYTKTLQTPREQIESKGSESVPVIHRSKHHFQENWYITKSTKT